ncbi:hypothetical protein DPMN_181720 [Dreissena polymorpha]|uniref:Uncharacterized protein n=1 Tax=Dreissena polymorpha TaxID=45954 RepID=A0A9D4I1X4_DREPO|nr:hypothetical protein DPMN_181720 [Dreissena polymorpha]
MSTLDGMNYTFNGLGEYVLLSIETSHVTFSLQARTERAVKEDGNLSDATIFTAFAARDNTNSSIHVELNKAKDSKCAQLSCRHWMYLKAVVNYSMKFSNFMLYLTD